MAAKKRDVDRESGGKRLGAKGYKPILLRVTPDEHEMLRDAARKERRPITQFMLRYGLDAARRVLAADL